MLSAAPLVSLRTVHLRVTGLVQGVSYRASARDEAMSLGLVGWVRNLPNGDVEAVASGPVHAVGQFIEWCRHGPDEARVDDLATTEIDRDPSLAGFEVRR